MSGPSGRRRRYVYKVALAVHGGAMVSQYVRGPFGTTYRLGRATVARAEAVRMGYGLCCFRRLEDALNNKGLEADRILRCVAGRTWTPAFGADCDMRPSRAWMRRPHDPSAGGDWPEGTIMTDRLTPVSEVKAW